jgi:hypothetical protein
MTDTTRKDTDSGLVYRLWTRLSRKKTQLTEESLEGQDVRAAFLDEGGGVVRVEGTVARDAEGRLVVKSWVEHVGGKPTETRVPRDSIVYVIDANGESTPPRGGRKGR